MMSGLVTVSGVAVESVYVPVGTEMRLGTPVGSAGRLLWATIASRSEQSVASQMPSKVSAVVLTTNAGCSAGGAVHAPATTTSAAAAANNPNLRPIGSPRCIDWR